MTSETPLSLDVLRPQFEAQLRAASTSFEAPTLAETWRAFQAFAQISFACGEENLFFECGLSPSNEDRFYVHFTRTFFGRDAGNHFWSSEVNCDFLFHSDEKLEELGTTIEAEIEAETARAEFFAEVSGQPLWEILRGQVPVEATIYIGES